MATDDWDTSIDAEHDPDWVDERFYDEGRYDY